MINFRFHLVSIVAVFLALAVGVVMGSTVIDRVIVDGLHSEISRIEEKADAEKVANDDLRNEVQRLQGAVQAAEPFAVADRLRGASVAVVAIDGVNADAVRSTVKLARGAGAQVPGIFWLQSRWELPNAADVAALAGAVGVAPSGTRTATRDAALDALAGRLRAGSSTAAARSGGDVLRALVDAGFLRYEAVAGAPVGVVLEQYPQVGARVLLVGGQSERVHGTEIMVPAVSALVRAGLPTVAAETLLSPESTKDRGAIVGLVRDDESLRTTVSTVDDLDRMEGQLSVVLALHDLGKQLVGHYGYGAGATRSVPAWPAS